MHGEGGQATVEWLALVLLAALALGATAAFAGREPDDGLGKEVAKRIASAAGAAPPGRPAPAAMRPAPPATRAAPPGTSAAPPTLAAPPATRAAAPAADAFRGVADVAKHAWIVCLGYERWRHELEHPSAPTEPLPVDVALDIVNTCFNPHDYLLEEE